METSGTTSYGKILVVYNKLSIESVLAATAIAKAYPAVATADMLQKPSELFDTYVWVGVTMQSKLTRHYDREGRKCHIVIQSDKHEESPKSLKDRLMGVLKRDRQERNDYQDETVTVPYKPSLIRLAADLLRFDFEPWRKLDYQVTKFHSAKTEIEMLVYCFLNARAGYEFLEARQTNHGAGFEMVVKPTVEQINSYFTEIEVAKRNLKNGYVDALQYVKGTPIRVIYTTYSDFRFILIRRLVEMSSEKFINASLGLTGISIFTNLTFTDEMEFNNETHIVSA